MTHEGSVPPIHVFDGDGARVSKRITAGGDVTTTLYVGNYFELTTSGGVTTTTKYYYFGAQRLAMKQGSTVTYLHSDHLGSTNVASNSGGTEVGRQTYYPFGVPRTTSGNLQTDFAFTGQKLDASDGLMYYGARYYDAALGRFISADTIVPNPGNPQSLNRYSYGLNNPVKYIDPTGHSSCGQDGGGCKADDIDEAAGSTAFDTKGATRNSWANRDDLCNLARCDGYDPSKTLNKPPADEPVEGGGLDGGLGPAYAAGAALKDQIGQWFATTWQEAQSMGAQALATTGRTVENTRTFFEEGMSQACRPDIIVFGEDGEWKYIADSKWREIVGLSDQMRDFQVLAEKRGAELIYLVRENTHVQSGVFDLVGEWEKNIFGIFAAR